MPKFDWSGYFPYKEIRPAQKKAIDDILNAFEGGKKYFVLEAGTGVGKSAIGITVSRYVANHLKKEKDYLNQQL